jgi:predicted nucleotidyltransferase
MSAPEQQDHDQSRNTPCGSVEIESRVREVVDRIVKQVHPLRIVLFGSSAGNGRGPESDVDLLVVMPEGTHKRQTAQTLYRRLRGLRVPVDILVTTQGDWDRQKDSPGLIHQTILREGRDLYAA